MRRILFRFFGTPIYSYPAMLYLGIVLGIYAELHAAKSIGMDLHRTLFATLILLSMALLGARLLHVVPLWYVYRYNLKRILHFSNGGASMYGGLLVAVPASLPLLAAFGLPFGSFWDVASFTMLVGMVVTRVGCFLNGCCCGRPTLGRWGLNLPDHEGVWRKRIPMQMWEAAWGAAVLVGGIMVWSIRPFDGALFFLRRWCVWFGSAGARVVPQSTELGTRHQRSEGYICWADRRIGQRVFQGLVVIEGGSSNDRLGLCIDTATGVANRVSVSFCRLRDVWLRPGQHPAEVQGIRFGRAQQPGYSEKPGSGAQGR